MEQTPIYDVHYFIRKFEAIPESKWTTGSAGTHRNQKGEYCAYGHCGVLSGEQLDTPEAIALGKFFVKIDSGTFYNRLTWGVVKVNDNGGKKYYNEPTPKLRILAALYDIREMLNKEPEVEVCDATKADSSTTVDKQKTIHIYHSVSVPSSIQEQSKELILS